MAFFLTFVIFLCLHSSEKKYWPVRERMLATRARRIKPSEKNNNMKKNNISKVERIMLLNAKTALNVEDVAAYTGHQTSYIYKLVSERKIPHYKREGGKFVYFKKSDIDEWMLSHRVATVDEISGQASAYVERNPIQEVVFAPSKSLLRTSTTMRRMNSRRRRPRQNQPQGKLPL